MKTVEFKDVNYAYGYLEENFADSKLFEPKILQKLPKIRLTLPKINLYRNLELAFC